MENLPELSPDELKNVSQIFKAHGLVEKHDFENSITKRNIQMRLMIKMQQINRQHKGYESPNPIFIRTYVTAAQFYSNVAKRVNDKVNAINGQGKHREIGLKAIDKFRKQNLLIKSRLTDGENFATINRQSGLVKTIDDDTLSKAYNDEWLRFATTYPHNDYKDVVLEAQSALNSALNDPGDTDFDGHTLVPAGTSAKQLADNTPQVTDINQDGSVDVKDHDLMDGRIDHPDNFTPEELAFMEDLVDPSELEDIDDFDFF